MYDIHWLVEHSYPRTPQRVVTYWLNEDHAGDYDSICPVQPSQLNIAGICLVERWLNDHRWLELWYRTQRFAIWAPSDQDPKSPCPYCPTFGQQTEEDRRAIIDGLAKRWPQFAQCLVEHPVA